MSENTEQRNGKPEPLWKQLEMLVAEIQRELAPAAEVTHNAKLEGRDSKQIRQIDVLVRQRIGQYDMVVVVDCKDYAEPVDVKGVEEFHGLATDVGAHKAAMVAPRGFTAAAKTLAARRQIDLYSPIDTDPHKWQVKPSMPVVCDFRGAGISFGIASSAPAPFRMSAEFWNEVHVFDENGKDYGTPLEIASARWNNGEYPIEPGEQVRIPLLPIKPTLVDNGHGTRIPVALTIGLYVEQQLFFGMLPITKMRGLRDELTGNVVTNAFTTGSLDPDEVIQTWQQIANDAEAPRKPVLKFFGLVAWGAI